MLILSLTSQCCLQELSASIFEHTDGVSSVDVSTIEVKSVYSDACGDSA